MVWDAFYRVGQAVAQREYASAYKEIKIKTK
jgi:hypothetical protein